MTHQELAESVAITTDKDLALVYEILSCTFGIMSTRIIDGDSVTINGLGTFEVAKSKVRNREYVRFAPSTGFRMLLNQENGN